MRAPGEFASETADVQKLEVNLRRLEVNSAMTPFSIWSFALFDPRAVADQIPKHSCFGRAFGSGKTPAETAGAGSSSCTIFGRPKSRKVSNGGCGEERSCFLRQEIQTKGVQSHQSLQIPGSIRTAGPFFSSPLHCTRSFSNPKGTVSGGTVGTFDTGLHRAAPSTKHLRLPFMWPVFPITYENPGSQEQHVRNMSDAYGCEML